MATPSLILRFRDVIFGIDTIQEHKAVIDSEGAVWWGWWKKDTEPDQDEIVEKYGKKNGTVILMDRSTKRSFLAEYIKIVNTAETIIDNSRIPAYYRNQSSKIKIWFLLKKINSTGFNDSLAKRIGESTIAILEEKYFSKDYTKFEINIVEVKDRKSILHLSDLHFGADYSFSLENEITDLGDPKKTLTKCIVDDLGRLGKRNDIGLLIITGDFTTQGDWSDKTKGIILNELNKLMNELNITKEQVIIVPGNHDVIRYPKDQNIDYMKFTVEQQTHYRHENDFRLFSEELTGISWKEPLSKLNCVKLENVDVQVCSLNSCSIASTKWTEYGYVGQIGIDLLERMANCDIKRPTLRILALHHHLLPINRVDNISEKGVSLTLDAVDILDSACKANIHLVIHGHQHLPRVIKYGTYELMNNKCSNDIILISSGSTGVKPIRRPGSERNSYTLIEPEDNHIRLIIRELREDARQGATLFNEELPIKYLTP